MSKRYVERFEYSRTALKRKTSHSLGEPIKISIILHDIDIGPQNYLVVIKIACSTDALGLVLR
jgi:hypothetical protein